MLQNYAEARKKFGRSFDLFGPQILQNPELGEALIAFETLGDICRNIRTAFGTDEPTDFMEGEELNGTMVTAETIQHVRDIRGRYDAAYTLLCERMKELENGKDKG